MSIQKPLEFQSFLDKESHGDARKKRKWIEAKYNEIKHTQVQISDEVKAAYAEIFKNAGREDLANKISNNEKPNSKSKIEAAEAGGNYKYLVPQQLEAIRRIIEKDKRTEPVPKKKESITLLTKPGFDASRTYLIQPTDRMLEYDEMLRQMRSTPIPSPFSVRASWLREAGIDPNTIDGYKPSSDLDNKEDWFDYTAEGREMWIREAEEALKGLGYTVLRRPDWEGKENKVHIDVLLDKDGTVN